MVKQTALHIVTTENAPLVISRKQGFEKYFGMAVQKSKWSVESHRAESYVDDKYKFTVILWTERFSQLCS
jgi:hypothetical protein